MLNFKKVVFLVLFLIQAVCAEVGAQLVNKVVAVVNDEVITQQDVDQLLSVLYAQYVQAYKGDELLKKMEEVKKDLLRQMIEDKLILSRAKELDVKVTAEDIKNKLAHIKAGFSSEKDFYNMLETQGITVANLKDRYRDQIMMKKLVDFEIRSRVSVLPSEATEYYEKHRQEFRHGGEYKVRHILIKAGDDMGFDLAKIEIGRLHNRLKNGKDFAGLAKEYSQGPNKEQGGAMGYIERGEMLEELEEAIFSLGVGDFSEPVKSEVGYHIFKVEDARHLGYFSLEDAQKGIKMMLFQKKFREKLDEWIAELSKEAYISIK